MGLFRKTLNSCFGIFWEITGKISQTGKIFPVCGQNGKSTNEKFWENMGLFRKTCRSKLVVGNFGIFREIIISSFMIFVEIPFWDILGNFGKWKTMVLYNRHLLISVVTTVFYLVLFVMKLGFWGSLIKQFSWLLWIQSVM